MPDTTNVEIQVDNIVYQFEVKKPTKSDEKTYIRIKQ